MAPKGADADLVLMALQIQYTHMQINSSVMITAHQNMYSTHNNLLAVTMFLTRSTKRLSRRR